MKTRIVLAIAILLSCAASLFACVYNTGGPLAPIAGGPDASLAPPPKLGEIVQVWNGDLDGSTNSTKIVTGIEGRGVSASAPSTGNTLGWNGSVWVPGALNLAGGSGYVTGTLPAANQASQTLGGDLSGTTAAGTVRLASTASHIDLGGTVATSGSIRAANNTTIIASRNTTNTGDYPLFATNTSDNLIVGDTTGALNGTMIYGGNTSNTLALAPTYAQLHGTSLAVVDSNDLRFRDTNGNIAAEMVGTGTAGQYTWTFSGTSLTMAPYVDYAQQAAPSSPSSGNVRVYTDSADGKLKAKDPSGNIFVLAP